MVLLLDIKDVIRWITHNWKKSTDPLGVDQKDLIDWARKSQIKGKGEAYLYTGGLYQMIPHINAYTTLLKKFETNPIGSAALKLAIVFNGKDVGLSKVFVNPPTKSKERYYQIIANVFNLVQRSGIDLAYLYEKDLYNGILFYNMGLDAIFEQHARLVAKTFKDNEVKKVITIDPHTTMALKELYPKFIEGWNVEVKHYLEVIDERKSIEKGKLSNRRFTIHDPCLLARRLRLHKRLRELLDFAGADVVEPERSGLLTYCCGGPIENLAPGISSEVSTKRGTELKSYCDMVLVACPICLANLSRVSSKTGIHPIDVLEVL